LNPEVVLVAALDRNRAIGKNGELPWRLRDDLKAFKSLTLGSPVVMGRKTWESIGRPLPGRQNIVLSRGDSLQAEGAEVVPSPRAAVEAAGDAEVVYVIGGGAVYEAFLPLADRLVLSRVDTEVGGADAWFPLWDADAYRLVSAENFPADDRNEFPFVIETYVQTGPDS
jgi:dihydrofolate reductase